MISAVFELKFITTISQATLCNGLKTIKPIRILVWTYITNQISKSCIRTIIPVF